MAAFWRPPNFFTQNTGDEGKLIQDFVGWLLHRRVCVASKKKKKKKPEHIKQNTERCFVVNKVFSLKEPAERVGKY